MMFCKDTNLIFTECNKAMENHFKLDRSDIIGKNDMDALNFPPEFANKLMAIDKSIIVKKHVSISEEPVQSTDGQKIYLEIIRAPLIQNNKVAGLVGMARDITKRKLMEEETKKAFEETKKAFEEAHNATKTKSRFIANMSHEMRTPMNVVVGLTDLMLEEEDVPNKV
jgi:PAS domain S-box-containing protein